MKKLLKPALILAICSTALLAGGCSTKTVEEQKLDLHCEIASLEKELETRWKIETEGNYMFGGRIEIVECEKNLAYKRKRLELLSR